MASHSPHPDSLSPHGSKGPVSAFQWPIPPSPSHTKPVSSASSLPDITVKEILDKYQDDPELLKYILSAKSEEDKKQAAKDTLKAEEARIQLKQMDLDLAREQTKAHARYERPPPPPPPMQYGYYSLAPVQQQVLARFQQPPAHPYRPPPSPAGYPHSAHPLCPPTEERAYHPRLQPYHRQTSPISPSVTDTKKSLKRNRMSISNDEDKLSHNKVMEALKAKIQRGGGPMSPLGPPTPRDPLEKKKKFSAPTPTETTASPRSAKPYLPPIDTNMGRIDTNHEKSDSSSSSSESEEENKAKHVGSPSDPILVNARRARSLSPSSAKKS